MKADLVMATMKGIRRQHGTRQRAVKPITRDVLLEMLAVLDQQKSHPTKAARDRLCCWSALLVRSAALSWWPCGWRT